ncbi:guanylate kinase [Candidatus Poribacteria bacterium]|nr:guanylate kinase [Candidatus Poribacteria bacterium]MYA99615.1 guanylate kinase [Candidatus Poribacteria bacterium]
MANTPLYKPNLVIVISGPSGSGKSTVIDALCKSDETLRFSISATTRKPRRSEVDGVDYHFLPKAEFEKHIQQGSFLEWAEYGGNFYGTLKSEIVAAREAEKDAILEIEVKGTLQIRTQDLSPARSLFIFIIPPSFAILEKRLRRRKTESETEVKKRLAIAKSEILEIEHFDYWISNPENAPQKAVQQIQAIIAAERSRIDTQLIETINPLLGVDQSD